MIVSVTSTIEHLNPQVREAIELRMSSTLARFAQRIARVSVTVVDENGPRGGVDKLCRVNMLMPGVGTITTTARHEKLMAAVSDAARRARRIVVTKMQRPQSLRLRRRTKGHSALDTNKPALENE